MRNIPSLLEDILHLVESIFGLIVSKHQTHLKSLLVKAAVESDDEADFYPVLTMQRVKHIVAQVDKSCL